VSARPSVTVRAPAKVNLGLAVGPRRADGFHPLVTVFQAVSLYEEVTATAADRISVTVSGPGAELVPTDRSNLAWRAAELVARESGAHPGVHLHIAKRVPVAGGMAGGSADGAAALLACDALWGAGLGRERLLQLAAELGSDVPFSLVGHTAMGTGRGELLSPVLSAGRYHWALATRVTGLSTPAVFRRFDELAAPDLAAPTPSPALLTALRAADVVGVGAALVNDLQAPALDLAPQLEATMAAARGAGALGVLVSGSGPTVAALARSKRHATAIGAAMTADGGADAVLTVTGPVPGAHVL
jgi:4-diphosphocytidyl-2-C-methyl-D-erythritol kinase